MPETFKTARLRALGDLTAHLTEHHGGRHVSFATRRASREGLLSADGLHINARGHAVVALLAELTSSRLPQDGEKPPTRVGGRLPGRSGQLQPEVEPQPSQT